MTMSKKNEQREKQMTVFLINFKHKKIKDSSHDKKSMLCKFNYLTSKSRTTSMSCEHINIIIEHN